MSETQIYTLFGLNVVILSYSNSAARFQMPILQRLNELFGLRHRCSQGRPVTTRVNKLTTRATALYFVYFE